MATLQTYQAVGNREDLINVLTRVAVEETPFLSSLARTQAKGTLHEWITESLDSPADNAQVEGADASFGTLTPRTRLGNYTQISSKTGMISDTQEAVNKAGVASEYSHQVEKAMKELARDMERVMWQGTKSVGTASAARRCGGVFYWTSTNRVTNGTSTTVTGTATAGGANTITVAAGHGSAATDHILLTGGTGQGQYRRITNVATNVLTVHENWDVQPDNTTTYIIYKADVAINETSFNDGIQNARDAGGKPTRAFVDGKTKRGVSAFSTSIRRVNDGNKTQTAAIDVYDSDFGPISMEYDTWAPVGTVSLIDTKMWKLATLQPVKVEELARTGTARKFQIVSEYTLESLGENANALVLGATSA